MGFLAGFGGTSDRISYFRLRQRCDLHWSKDLMLYRSKSSRRVQKAWNPNDGQFLLEQARTSRALCTQYFSDTAHSTLSGKELAERVVMCVISCQCSSNDFHSRARGLLHMIPISVSMPRVDLGRAIRRLG